MKKQGAIISPLHTINIIKLCYILILACSLFALKVLIYPEGEYQVLLAVTQIPIFLESLSLSLVICTCLSVVIFRAIW
jgi:hypothetical protein